MYEITLQIRPAEAEDLKLDKRLINGKMFFLKPLEKEIIEGPYFISSYTDRLEFSNWFLKGMVYVAVSPLENNIKINN